MDNTKNTTEVNTHIYHLSIHLMPYPLKFGMVCLISGWTLNSEWSLNQNNVKKMYFIVKLFQSKPKHANRPSIGKSCHTLKPRYSKTRLYK